MGFVYRNESLVDNLGLAAYFMYATIGASGITNTGADVALGGATGNFRDRDYLRNYGLRARYDASYESGLHTDVYFEFGLSEGVDRKAPEYVDVDLGGTMFGGGVGVGYDFGAGSIGVGGDYYSFDGASYSATGGLEFDRGFTSMRGDRVGGIAMGRLASWRPSAVLDRGGIDHSPHDWDRQAGLSFARAGSTSPTRTSPSRSTSTSTRTPPRACSTSRRWRRPRRRSASAVKRSTRSAAPVSRWATSSPLRFARSSQNGQASLGLGLFNPGEYYDIEVARVASFNDDRPGARWRPHGAVLGLLRRRRLLRRHPHPRELMVHARNNALLLGAALLTLVGCQTELEPEGFQFETGYRSGTSADDYTSNVERGSVWMTEVNWAGSVEQVGDGFVHHPDDVFIELQNKFSRPLHLTGWQLIVEAGTTNEHIHARGIEDSEIRYLIPERENGQPVNPNEYVVIASRRDGAFPNADYYIEDFQLPLRPLEDQHPRPRQPPERGRRSRRARVRRLLGWRHGTLDGAHPAHLLEPRQHGLRLAHLLVQRLGPRADRAARRAAREHRRGVPRADLRHAGHAELA